MNDTITILHVDDDEDIRTITELSLSLGSGFELYQCASGPEAIEMAPRINPDVFILDMVMPGMNGEETWKRLKDVSGLQAKPTIFMSARAEEDFAERLVAMGAAGVITKPFDPVNLGQDIKDVLAEARKSAAGTGSGSAGIEMPSET